MRQSHLCKQFTLHHQCIYKNYLYIIVSNIDGNSDIISVVSVLICNYFVQIPENVGNMLYNIYKIWSVLQITILIKVLLIFQSSSGSITKKTTHEFYKAPNTSCVQWPKCVGRQQGLYSTSPVNT